VAVLYQAIAPPAIDGGRKPLEPGGYSDSGADVASALRGGGAAVVTPVPAPSPDRAMDWVFPDHAQGIAAARAAGAHILWANTVLFAGHPLEAVLREAWIVGQVPADVETFDDKAATNARLRQAGLPLPAAWVVGERPPHEGEPALAELSPGRLAEAGWPFPLVVKPVRGRGSQGVARVGSPRELEERVRALWAGGYGRRVLLEAYLAGREYTLTVMPPGRYLVRGTIRHFAAHWALPPVHRFNQVDGVAPYSGEVAVIRNSETLDAAAAATPKMRHLAAACERAAALVRARAPIRIDCREDAAGRPCLFDLNLKPNLTGPGRPGRDDQDSLVGLAARGLGWSYPDLLQAMLGQAWRAE
jgi:biotin carboxylase